MSRRPGPASYTSKYVGVLEGDLGVLSVKLPLRSLKELHESATSATVKRPSSAPPLAMSCDPLPSTCASTGAATPQQSAHASTAAVVHGSFAPKALHVRPRARPQSAGQPPRYATRAHPPGVAVAAGGAATRAERSESGFLVHNAVSGFRLTQPTAAPALPARSSPPAVHAAHRPEDRAYARPARRPPAGSLPAVPEPASDAPNSPPAFGSWSGERLGTSAGPWAGERVEERGAALGPWGPSAPKPRRSSEPAAELYLKYVKVKTELMGNQRRPEVHVPADVRRAFEMFDTHQSDGIRGREIRRALLQLGMDADSSEAEAVLQPYDADKDSRLNLVEFHRLVQELLEFQSQSFQKRQHGSGRSDIMP